MDKRLSAAYFFTAGISTLSPIAAIFTLRYLLDNILSHVSPEAKTVPLIIIIILAARYILIVIDRSIQTGLYATYYDYIFRYRLQSELLYRFCEKSAGLDMAHLEDSDTQTLITKARDTLAWRPPEFLRQFSLLFGNIISFIIAFFMLVPFGAWIPLVIMTAGLPRLIFRIKQGAIQYSIYSGGAPEAKKFQVIQSLFWATAPLQEIKIFQSAPALLSKLRAMQEHLFDLNKKNLNRYLLFLPFPTILEAIMLFGIIFLSLPNVLSGALTIGVFSLLINTVDRLNSNTVNIVSIFGQMYENNLYVNDYFCVLDLPELIKEPPDPVSFTELKPPSIEFRNVSFNYPRGPRVLDNISFTINPGEKFAIVGPNGAGKTTIVKLLCRFYDVSSGEILVNGVNIKNLKLENWYRFLGTLFQQFVHYKLSVRDNITLGSPSKTDEKLLMDAAVKSGAYSFIQNFPDKFDQILGREFENGRELSVGEWQKLAVARAFYEAAPVLILDEPTSAIDAEDEYAIFQNLTGAYKDKSLVLISHRFSTVRNADTILILENGSITERGSHTHLMNLNGKYAGMFKTQATGYK
ncbi:MAG: ABC transporter ATP-binding protein [Candidatus Omnitrophota bacterium]